MKNIFKKLFTLLMVFAFALTVNAAGEGSITINNEASNTDVNYNIYKLLDMSYDEESDSVAYTINSSWTAFFAQADVKELITTITATDGTVYVTEVEDAKTLAEKAIAYAVSNKIEATTTASISSDKESTKVTGLDLGYYLVDSTLGALVHLTSTKPDAEINEKNEEPSIEKETNVSTIAIGQTIPYTITVSVKPGAENYKITDVLSKGLTLNTNSFTYTYEGTYEGSNPTPSISTNSTTKETTFTIDYTGIDLTKVTEIVIEYTANVNSDAVLLDEVENNVSLDYGRDNTIASEPVITPIGQFTIIKTNDENETLEGATFELYKDNVKINLYYDATNKCYRPALNGETVSVITAGTATVRGLEIGDYKLEEVTPPTGYTKLAAREKVSATQDGNVSKPHPIVNTKGAVLTPTGGMGTTLFVTFGSIIVLACGLVLVAKFRMSRI